MSTFKIRAVAVLAAFVLASHLMTMCHAQPPSFPFTYTVSGSNLVLTMKTKSSAAQWLAVGFNANGKMYPSDAIECEIGTVTRCTDRQCTSYAECSVDPVQNISFTSSTSGGITTFIVTRALNTGDPNDAVISATTAPKMIWGWAAGATNVVHSEQNSFTPTLSTSGSGTGTTSSALDAMATSKAVLVGVCVLVMSLLVSM